METIRNYLENMFMNLPKTKEVLKAKMELGQMMEDKYNELIAEGKTDNEATGIVISEFGNLDELAEDLGINSYMKRGNFEPKKTLSMDTVKQFISQKINSSINIALAVLLCICSPVVIIVTEALSGENRMGGEAAEVIGVVALFGFVALAVGMLIYNGIKMSKWDYLKREALQLDFATEGYVREQLENYRSTYALYITLGVVLCITSVIPAAVIGCISSYSSFMDDLSGAFVLIMVAVGVMFFILGCMRKGCYETLLNLNHVLLSEQEERQGQLEKDIMSIYWPTITCVYLIWSFLSMAWYITWVIWPLAAIFANVIKLICREKNNK